MSGAEQALIASSDDELRWFNTRFAAAPATEPLQALLRECYPGRAALVSSFGAEAAVTLRLATLVEPRLPVIFLDTGKHFAATLAYVEQLQQRLGLADLRILRPVSLELTARDPYGLLHRSDPDRCCELRKLAPLQSALRGFDAWITGRKRAHGGARRALPLADRDRAGRLRINPLWDWDAARIDAFMREHDLPRHPLQAEGYSSVGCEPCTARSSAAAAPRGGRWQGRPKSECGIHML